MSDNKKIVYSIIKFLKDELNVLSPEACESIEVAIQCLENAYEIHSDDPALDTGTPLTNLFDSQPSATASSKVATSAEKEEAEKLKTEGNNLVKAKKFEEAIKLYTKAIQLDPNNPVYYGNRAAAYSRLNNHLATIEDCKAALKIEPTYSKAYSRLGFAYTSLHMFQEAKQCYKKALEIEPGNPSYLNNLELCERLKNMSSSELENFNMNIFLGSPTVRLMASQMMSDPTMQNMMTTLMSESMGENNFGMEALMQVGQRIAQYMQNTNPELVEELRQEISNAASNAQTPQTPQTKKTN